MKLFSIKNICFFVAFACYSSLSYGGSKSVSIAGENDSSFVESVFGVWSYNEKVDFSESGSYSLSLTDFSFGSDFDYVGAMISTPTSKIAEVSFYGRGEYTKSLNFNITEGQYWVSLFAITDSQFNTGTLGFDISNSSVSEVPLPAGVWLFFSALSFFGVFVSKLKTGNKVSIDTYQNVSRKAKANTLFERTVLLG